VGKICGIYCIENTVNNKKYIGQSVDIKCRWRNHRYELRNNRHDNIHLQNAWNTYGEDNFVWNILEQCDVDLLDDRESYYIVKYHSNNCAYGYNHESGGHTNKQLSDEHREKLSNAHKGKILTDEHKKHISDSGKGRVFSDETRQKISNKLKGVERPSQKKGVYCIELDVVYDSIKSASAATGIWGSNIGACCRGIYNYAGKHPDTGEPLHWYYTDSLTQQND
jgi:group I intron endonuclease